MNMALTLTVERASHFYEKVCNFRIPATVLHAGFLILLLALAAQGIPFLAAHAANVISSVRLGYWLVGGAAVLGFSTILWILFNEN